MHKLTVHDDLDIPDIYTMSKMMKRMCIQFEYFGYGYTSSGDITIYKGSFGKENVCGLWVTYNER